MSKRERERTKLSDLLRFGFLPMSPPQEHYLRIPKFTIGQPSFV